MNFVTKETNLPVKLSVCHKYVKYRQWMKQRGYNKLIIT